MSTLRDIREAIAAALSTIGGLQGLPAFPPSLHPPAAVVEFDRVDYLSLAMTGLAEWYFNITVLVSPNDLEAAQAQLDAYLTPSGPSSIREALEGDPTLGGVVNDVALRSADGFQPYDVGAETLWGVRLRVEVR